LVNILHGIIWTLVGLLLMAVAQFIIRHVTFDSDLDLSGHITGMTQQAEEGGYGGNLAAAVVDAGAVISAGLVTAGNLSGAPRGWGDDIAAVLACFVLSQAAFYAYTRVFDYFFIAKVAGNADGTIEGAIKRQLPHAIAMPEATGLPPVTQGNVAAAISYGSMMVSYALLINNAIYQSYELASLIAWLILGGALLLLLRYLLDVIIVPQVELSTAVAQLNWGYPLVIGAIQLSCSRIICAVMDSSCSPYKYLTGPGVGPNAIVVDSDLGLLDAMTQYQQAIDLFTLRNLLSVTVSIALLILGKYTYQVTYYARNGSDLRLVDRISGRGHQMRPAGNNALSISFAGYMFALGNILAGKALPPFATHTAHNLS
jgi:uncharacterized membrane protein YjfL (UPF0719 family)